MAETQANANPQPAAGIGAYIERLRNDAGARNALIIGVPLVIALVFGGWQLSSSAGYEALYRGLPESDAGAVMEALQRANLPYRVDSRTGALMVPSSQVHETRLKLAAEGLPKGALNGFEMLDRDTGFGVSQFMENARYQRALEGELARSVMSIGAVAGARVHLALPKDTVFVRNRQAPSASVLLTLQPGRVLEPGQVAAITHLVSSSVPKLTAEQVSVVDQYGNLLSRSNRDAGLGLSLDQHDYTRRLEEHYMRRIEDIVTPIIGLGRVRAQVSVDVDFTVSEETSETFDPSRAGTQVRSERTLEDGSGAAGGAAVGVPGAMSNQPPGLSEAPETGVEPGIALGAVNESGVGTSGSRRVEVTRNYEIDKRVSHVRSAPGRVSRLSAAVVIDDKEVLNEKGDAVRTPLSSEELERITALVREAVGFNADRGDAVSVVNVAYASAADGAPGALPVWQEPWVLELVKWAVIALVAVLLLVLVVRPLLGRLLAPAPLPRRPALAGAGNGAGELYAEPEIEEDRVQIGGIASPAPRLNAPAQQLDQRLTLAKTLVAEDPKRAVQVIKNWIQSEG